VHPSTVPVGSYPCEFKARAWTEMRKQSREQFRDLRKILGRRPRVDTERDGYRYGERDFTLEAFGMEKIQELVMGAGGKEK
jgi:hypothetical protein